MSEQMGLDFGLQISLIAGADEVGCGLLAGLCAGCGAVPRSKRSMN